MSDTCRYVDGFIDALKRYVNKFGDLGKEYFKKAVVNSELTLTVNEAGVNVCFPVSSHPQSMNY